MSEPKRYERCYHKDYIPEGMEEHYNGKWVKWEDYARIKAEVENSKRINTELLALSNRQASDIRRLTKAGDELERVLTSRMSSYEVGNASHEWRSAKGVQS